MTLPEAAITQTDPTVRHQELLAGYERYSAGLAERSPGMSHDAWAQDRHAYGLQHMEPALDNLFDRMRESGMVRQGEDGSEVVELHAPRHSPNAGQITFARGRSDTGGTRVVMTFAGQPFRSSEHYGGVMMQRGHTVVYDSATRTLEPSAEGPQFSGGRGLAPGADSAQWLDNILTGRTDLEYLADEAAMAQTRQRAEAVGRVASLRKVVNLKNASWLGMLSPKVRSALREHKERYVHRDSRA